MSHGAITGISTKVASEQKLQKYRINGWTKIPILCACTTTVCGHGQDIGQGFLLCLIIERFIKWNDH